MGVGKDKDFFNTEEKQRKEKNIYKEEKRKRGKEEKRGLWMNEADTLCSKIIGACIEVHKALGPGLMEQVYQQCLCRELSLQGLQFKTEIPVTLSYKGIVLDVALRADLLVEDMIIVEIKAVNDWNAIYEAQLISYLKLANKPAGLLINFNVHALKDGIKRLFREA